MNWIELSSIEQLNNIADKSNEKPIVIFKHSTRCSISAMAIDRLDRSWDNNEMKDTDAYYLDLLSYRHVSNAVADKFGIEHQSPQVLVISEGKCIADWSHSDIRYATIKQVVHTSPNFIKHVQPI